ncbi:uncharacterized protein EI90DRAFT_3126599 [Cantharellus anzutake]|uniref:uncharacterized protein n=1 Tax=Cantharellus anzutake TaxID=1750568 RepID=UPI0019049250|nr:uncharacterized protein EI90DRAFT_3126599 [Cantharellus anzutake]KAF8327953.1 hypothetical protein EI90DRAFT_3126599 [Cantharellus anzutake]
MHVLFHAISSGYSAKLRLTLKQGPPEDADHTNQDPESGNLTRDDSDSGDNGRAGDYVLVSADSHPNYVGVDVSTNSHERYPHVAANNVFAPYPVEQISSPMARERFDEHGVNEFPAHPVDQVPIEDMRRF